MTSSTIRTGRTVKRRKLYIAFVGDSFVNGTGDPEYLGWAGRICTAARSRGYEITYYNLGVRGETSADLKARWLTEVTCRLPKGEDSRIIFSFGVNDTTMENGKTRVELDDSLENADEILHAAKQQFPVLVVGLPPVTDTEQNLRIVRLSKQFNSVCCKLDVPYLEVFTPLQKSAVWMGEVAANDGAHPFAGGYAELAQLVQSWSSWLSWFRGSE